ncbi:hypothetical protein BX600DRAFT_526311 [Xylariales sp. PMI_506]|nr:hypothetical protein BX600DRAFT_526311 [Xylariales sp. PMI_506]
MSERLYQLRDVGIYHGLPTYDPSIKGLTAIVTGATGISGHYMVRALSQSPARWSKIYCLSRRPPIHDVPQNAEHIPVDLLQSPKEIARTLKAKGIQKVDHVFFFAYIQVAPKPGAVIWSNAEEMCRVNTSLLSNFLEALPLANLKPSRILLQTGAKNYGTHLGPTAIPQEETDPRVTLEPNFYYTQEDYLWDYCSRHDIEWNVCMPSFILGAVPDAAMNVCFPLAVYAAVTRHLGKELAYPSDLRAWESPQSQSSAMLNAYMEEWAVLTPGAANQRFNTSDDSAFTWGKFWPRLAQRYGLGYTRPDLQATYTDVKKSYQTPPRGFGSNPGTRHKFTLVEWANRAEVQNAWKELAAEHNLLDKELRDIERIFSFTDAALSWSQNIYFSSDKARALGWHGHVNSSESIFEVLKEFEDIRMVPPIPELKSLD